jgi:hypothetical protein
MSKIILPDTEGHESSEAETPVSHREVLAKYLAYALPDVAAVSPTSALLLDKAIRELIDTAPHALAS